MLECQGSGCFRDGWGAQRNGHYQNESCVSNDWTGRGVTSSHRAIPLSWRVHCTAIALVLLHIAHLAMVKRAIGRIAASGQFGGGKSFGQTRYAWQKQRNKSRDSCEIVDGFLQFGSALHADHTREVWSLQYALIDLAD